MAYRNLENHMALPPHETGERYLSPGLTARIERERHERINRSVMERLRDAESARLLFERQSDAMALEGLAAQIIRIVGPYYTSPGEEAAKCAEVRQALADVIRGYVLNEITFEVVERDIGEQGR